MAGIKTKKMIRYYLYILADKKDGDIYIGSTSDLIGRVGEHKSNIFGGFTKNTSIHNLVYYEEHNDIRKAATREKQIKKWKREWKVELIVKFNPGWKDLYFDLIN
jgi:putative endonuclease